MKNVIIGAGAFGQVAKCYFEEFANIKIDNFAINQSHLLTQKKSELDILSVEELIVQNPKQYRIFIAIGYSHMNSQREDLFKKFSDANFEFLTFIHPNVKIWSNSSVGDNCFIFEDNTIQPFTTIGDNTVLWSGNHIGHHSKIGRHCFISSHVVVSGSCTIGDNTFIGVNATLHDGIEIGERTLIGAGAIISKNTQPESVYAPKSTVIFPKSSLEIGF